VKVVTRIQDFGKTFIIAVAALSLGACELMGPRKQEEAVVQEPEVEVEPMPPIPTDSLTPHQRVRKALDQLQHGDYENARNQLDWALLDKPNLEIAKDLLEQMDADPIEYLGLKNFFYDVQPGDTLSLIAKTFLNSPFKFVILARYNKLENPSKLASGQRIRVPGEMPEVVKPKIRSVTKPKPEPEIETEPVVQPTSIEPTPKEILTDLPPEPTQEPSIVPAVTEAEPKAQVETQPPPEPSIPSIEDIIDSARQLRAENDLPAAIYLLESEINRQPESQEIHPILANYYTEHADQLFEQNDLEGARNILEKLIILDASDNNAVNQLILVEDIIESKKLFEKAINLEQDGEYEQAYHTYGQVLTYDPNNPIAKEAQLKVRKQLTNNYHRQAMQLFRKQELDQAIAFWNKILELDPNHSLAPGYKARALEMKQQLQRIGTGDN
jgi:Tfp pilus assembly protein PilF/LysM repeat protein